MFSVQLQRATNVFVLGPVYYLVLISDPARHVTARFVAAPLGASPQCNAMDMKNFSAKAATAAPYREVTCRAIPCRAERGAVPDPM